MSVVGRTYLLAGRPVVVKIQWGPSPRGEPDATGKPCRGAPRNVLIQLGAYSEVRKTVRPFRGLRRSAGQIGGPWRRDDDVGLAAVVSGEKPCMEMDVRSGEVTDRNGVVTANLDGEHALWQRGGVVVWLPAAALAAEMKAKCLLVVRMEAEHGDRMVIARDYRTVNRLASARGARELGEAYGYSEMDIRAFYSWTDRVDPALGRVPAGDDLREAA